jgi:hypothetical protein
MGILNNFNGIHFREIEMKRISCFLLIINMIAGTLIILSGCGGGGGDGGNVGPPPLPEVAVLSNTAATQYGADVVDKLEATGKFSRVDTINAATLTPTVDQLLTYDGVLVFTGDIHPDIADTTALGDVLADYVDNGGGLVVAYPAVVYHLPEFALGGRYVSGKYYLIPRVGIASGSQVSGAVRDSTHPILDGFVTLDSGRINGWADTTHVMPEATVILEWADGKPLVVVSETAGIGKDQRRVDLNFYPPSSILMANSLTWVADWP